MSMEHVSTDKRQRTEHDNAGVWPRSGILWGSCGSSGRYRITAISSLDGLVTAAPSTNSYHVEHGYWWVTYTEGGTDRTILCSFDQATVLVDRIAGVLRKVRALRADADHLVTELVRHGMSVTPATHMDVGGGDPVAAIPE